MAQIIDLFLHLDAHLAEWLAFLGPWIYVLVFAIVFAETGLIFMPFLPGDSLLFALGALSVGSPVLNPWALALILLMAAFCGDNVNYRVGKILGQEWALRKKLLKPEHLERTQKFFVKYGAFAVVVARFIPIVRTISPFVAGMGSMTFPKFLSYSFLSSLLWVGIFVPAGYYFGNLPSVKSNFHYVIFGVIGLSLLPIVIPVALRQFRSQK